MAAALGSGIPVRIPPIARPTLFKASRRLKARSVLLVAEVGAEAGTKALTDETAKAKAQALIIRTILITRKLVG